jgi:predicted SnoaL-like aldol condensation-catalyzing enzyme
MRYKPGAIVAEGNLVMMHGRFSKIGQPANWILADIMRMDHGVLTEHWDMMQDEATQARSKSGNPMFGDRFLNDDNDCLFSNCVNQREHKL